MYPPLRKINSYYCWLSICRLFFLKPFVFPKELISYVVTGRTAHGGDEIQGEMCAHFVKHLDRQIRLDKLTIHLEDI